MDFIETLKSVGGVKPCPNCNMGIVPHDQPDVAFTKICPRCNGSNFVLDLAPLLAKPKELEELAKVLEGKLWEVAKGMIDDEGEFCVVGPQRANSLVYEVARQLGGTAVVAEPIVEERMVSSGGYSSIPSREKQVMGYRLSLPIPDNGTVLFVTDRLQGAEHIEILHKVAESAKTILPYILCLMSMPCYLNDEPDTLTIGLNKGPDKFRVISLHQEKT